MPVILSLTQDLHHAGPFRHAELDSASHPRISTTKIHSIMKKELSGDYLAPEIEVIQMQIRQTVLAGSPTNVNDPWDGDELDL